MSDDELLHKTETALIEVRAWLFGQQRPSIDQVKDLWSIVELADQIRIMIGDNDEKPHTRFKPPRPSSYLDDIRTRHTLRPGW